jgi:hypothetical protein
VLWERNLSGSRVRRTAAEEVVESVCRRFAAGVLEDSPRRRANQHRGSPRR